MDRVSYLLQEIYGIENKNNQETKVCAGGEPSPGLLGVTRLGPQLWPGLCRLMTDDQSPSRPSLGGPRTPDSVIFP